MTKPTTTSTSNIAVFPSERAFNSPFSAIAAARAIWCAETRADATAEWLAEVEALTAELRLRRLPEDAIAAEVKRYTEATRQAYRELKARLAIREGTTDG